MDLGGPGGAFFLKFTSCVVLDKSLNLSVSHFFSKFRITLLTSRNAVNYAKCLLSTWAVSQ